MIFRHEDIIDRCEVLLHEFSECEVFFELCASDLMHALHVFDDDFRVCLHCDIFNSYLPSDV